MRERTFAGSVFLSASGKEEKKETQEHPKEGVHGPAYASPHPPPNRPREIPQRRRSSQSALRGDRRKRYPKASSSVAAHLTHSAAKA